MEKIPAMQDMARTEADWEKLNPGMPCPENYPLYPYGLSISLENPELEKLKLTDEEVSVGDILHIHAFAVVTSVSESEREMNGKQRRVELELRNIVAEEEGEEDQAAESAMTKAPERRSRLYG
jgi:hypothetical protein